MERFGRGTGGAKRILELNPANPAVVAIRELHEKTATDSRIGLYAQLLLEQSVIAEGSKVSDPAAFAKRMNELIARDARI
jgi:molecular chaperone HtpG